MEHILQVAFQFDDEAVKNRLEEQAYKEVCARLYNDFCKNFTSAQYKNEYAFYRYRSKPNDIPSSDDIYNSIKFELLKYLDTFCEYHKDEIIDAAAIRLADKLSRTKKAKEIVNEH